MDTLHIQRVSIDDSETNCYPCVLIEKITDVDDSSPCWKNIQIGKFTRIVKTSDCLKSQTQKFPEEQTLSHYVTFSFRP